MHGQQHIKILLTVHPNIISIFFYQLDIQILNFFIYLLPSSTCFEHNHAHPQEIKLHL